MAIFKKFFFLKFQRKIRTFKLAGKESSPDDYFIVIFPLTEEDRDDYNRRNSIEIGLGRLGIVTETIYIWRREK